MGWKLEQGVFFGFFPCIAMAPKQESFFFFFFFWPGLMVLRILDS